MTPEAEPFLVSNLRKRGSGVYACYRKIYRSLPSSARPFLPLPPSPEMDRISAARILARIGPDKEETVQALIAALDDSDSGVVAEAASALGRIPKQSPLVDRALIKAALHQEEFVQFAAVRSLHSVGGPSAAARLARAQAGKEVKPYLKYSAVPYESQDVAWKPLPALISDLERPNETQRLDALRALTVYGPDAIDALPSLFKLIQRYLMTPTGQWGPMDKETVTNCIIAIGSIGPAASNALPMLKGATAHRFISVKRTAESAIRKIESSTDAQKWP